MSEVRVYISIFRLVWYLTALRLMRLPLRCPRPATDSVFHTNSIRVKVLTRIRPIQHIYFLPSPPLHPSLSLHTLIQPRNVLLRSSETRLSIPSHLLSKLNLPHMFCLIISDWDVMEPLSTPQLLTVRLAVLLLTAVELIVIVITMTEQYNHLHVRRS